MDHYNEVHVGLRPFICDGKYLYHYSIYITILTFMSVCPYGIRHPGPHFWVSAIKLQDVSDKTCFICVKDEKYAFLSHHCVHEVSRSWAVYIMLLGEAKPSYVDWNPL